MPRRRLLNAGDLALLQRFRETNSQINLIEREMNSGKKVEIEEPAPGDSAEVRDAEIFINGKPLAKISRYR